MFRLLSKQLVNTARRHGSPLYRGATLRGVHDLQPPYSGPPSYETIARRFSSPINPQTYFNRKYEKEAIGRGEFVDLRDFTGPDPRDYDCLIPDIDRDKLQHEISEVVGIPYHSPACKVEAGKVVKIGDGIIYGKSIMYGGKPRTIFPAIVGGARSNKAYWVFFLVDTASPLTYLSSQTCELFDITEGSMPQAVSIAGHWQGVYRSPASSQFAAVDILGMDFIFSHSVSLLYDGLKRRVKLYFDSDYAGILGKLVQ